MSPDTRYLINIDRINKFIYEFSIIPIEIIAKNII
jgi:hypothetical protein